MEGALLRYEPSTVSGFSVEGSRLDAEPSMIWGISMEGSVLENGTVREIDLYCGRLISRRRLLLPWVFAVVYYDRFRVMSMTAPPPE